MYAGPVIGLLISGTRFPLVAHARLTFLLRLIIAFETIFGEISFFTAEKFFISDNSKLF